VAKPHLLATTTLNTRLHYVVCMAFAAKGLLRQAPDLNPCHVRQDIGLAVHGIICTTIQCTASGR